MKVNYLKHIGNNGTIYNQTIKIDKWIMEYYNNYLNNLKIDIGKQFLEKHCYSENDLKIKSLDYLKKGINLTNLIHLDVFLQVINDLNKQGYNFDFKRILYRNTIIEVL